MPHFGQRVLCSLPPIYPKKRKGVTMDGFLQLRELTLLSVVLRPLVAILLGGIIGMERGLKNRAAGFRT